MMVWLARITGATDRSQCVAPGRQACSLLLPHHAAQLTIAGDQFG
jgi:hypothetical protein